jgi:hypothetical protein
MENLAGVTEKLNKTGQISCQAEEKRIGLTSYQLKWIAILTMVADHVGAILYPEYMVFRYIGRIAFPIFCFLLVEGFFHTHDVIQYMKRLAVFALVSEIPFDLAFHGKLLEFTYQNVFFTLFFGVFMMYRMQMAGSWIKKLVELLLIMWATVFLKTDYSYKGILLVLLFYITHEKRTLQLTGGALWNFLGNWKIQGWGAIAMLPIGLYNGEQGRKMKYFFYIFYPLHLLILYLVVEYVI